MLLKNMVQGLLSAVQKNSTGQEIPCFTES